MYRYVFKVDDFDAVVYSELEPVEVIKATQHAHDNAYGWGFENTVYFSANAMKNICMFVQPVEE